MLINRLVPFLSVMLTGISYPLLVVIARTLTPQNLLEVINFQSVTVFMTFILQLGLRTAVRMNYHYGFGKASASTILFINRFIFFISIPILIVEYIVGSYYILFALLQVSLTISQGYFVAKGEEKRVFLNSILIFLTIWLSGILVLSMGQHAVFYIEVAAFIVLALLHIYKKKRAVAGGSRIKTAYLIKKYWGIQLSSAIVYTYLFLLVQCFLIVLGKDNNASNLFADTIVYCGLQALFIGKALMFLEGKIVKKGGQDILVTSLIILVFLSACVFAVVTKAIGYSVSATTMLLLVPAILGRLLFSVLSQFLSGNFRTRLNYFGGGVCVVITFLFFALKWLGLSLSFEGLTYIFSLLSLFFIALLFFAYYRYRQIGIFHQKKEKRV